MASNTGLRQVKAFVSFNHKFNSDITRFEALANPPGGNSAEGKAIAVRKWNTKLTLDGTLKLSQNNEAFRATVTWKPNQYKYEKMIQGLATHELWQHEKARSLPDGYEQVLEDIERGPISAHIWLTLKDTGSSAFERMDGVSARAAQGVPDRPGDFPILNQLPLMGRLRIDIFDVGSLERWDKRRIVALLAGQTTWNPKTNMQDFLKSERMCVEAETALAMQSLKGIDDKTCMVWTEPLKADRSVLLCIEPPNSNAQTFNWENILPAGQLLEVENEDFFHPAKSEDCPSSNKSMPGRWVARVVHGLDRPAPITAILEHWFMGNMFREYSRIQPCQAKIMAEVVDVTTQRAREALDLTEDAFEEEEFLQLTEALTSIPQGLPEEIPIHSICLEGELIPMDPESLDPSGDSVLVDYSGDLYVTNPEQRWAVENIFNHQVSLIKGPPGCAKTQTIVFAGKAVQNHFPQMKILYCAPTNGACDEVGRKLEALGLQFIRMMSWKTFETYVAQKKQSGPNYLHEVMLRWACEPDNAHLMQGFFQGVEHLRQYGRITDRKVRKRYVSDRNYAMTVLLDTYRIVVSTCTSSALKILVDNFPAEILFVDEAAACKHYEVLIPLVKFRLWLKRLVLAGDELQFAPYAATNEAKKWWSTTLFEKMIKQDQWPTVLLSECYRQHSLLNGPSSQLFYGGQLRAHFQEPAKETQLLLQKFGDRQVGFLNGDDVSIHLQGICHFFDVEDSECEYNATLSSRNQPENECAEAIMKALIGAGVDASKILHITGYRWNQSDLQQKSRAGGWSKDHLNRGVDIKTVYSSQGVESPIVILTITRNMVQDDLLLRSFLNRARFLNVAISRPSQMFFIVGHWDSIMRLPGNNLLRKTMAFMMNHYQHAHDFVIRAGSSPFSVALERDVVSFPRISAVQTHVGRQSRALADVEKCEKELEEVREKVLARYEGGELHGFSEYMYWRCRFRDRLIFWMRWKEDRNWEVPENPNTSWVDINLRNPTIVAAAAMICIAKAHNQDPVAYEDVWMNTRADMRRGMELSEELKRLRIESRLAQAALDN